jgi:hypothetical protein
MMHEFKMMNIRNTKKRKGKCDTVVWSLKAPKRL